MKSSYSQNNVYKKCPTYWKHNYIDKLEAENRGASTYFGSAVDAAVESLLKKETNYLSVFRDRWETAFSFGERTKILDNPNVIFAHTDFDGDLLTEADFGQLQIWSEELDLLPRGTPKDNNKLIELFKQISKDKKNPFKKLSPKQLVYFNRAGWISMKRKGEILIEAFKDQFLPKVKNVLSTQQYAKLQDDFTGDIISGYIDMVLEIEGYDKPIIFDLKTAARPYEQEDIEITDQLTLYSAMKGKYSNDAQRFNTDLVGYIVLSKAIKKEVEGTCIVCYNKKTSTHKTCNRKINGVRCNGEWKETKTPKPEVQVMVAQKSIEQVQSTLEDVSNLLVAMKNNIIYKNTDNCNNWYGAKCPFFRKCYYNDDTGLKKRGEKK